MKRAVVNARWWLDSSPTNLLIENDRVVYRGADDVSAEETLNADGRFLLPAFVEPHCHILPAGMDLLRLDLSRFSSREEVLRAVSEAARSVAESDWLQVTHYDANRFADGKNIEIAELDLATGGVPTILRHSSGHSCLVNSRVVLIGGIADASDPSGGTVERDDNGSPTGILNETAMGLAYRHVPKPTKFQMRDAIKMAADHMRSFEITLAADMQTGNISIEDELWAYRAVQDDGCTVKMRLYLDWKAVFVKNVELADIKQDERLRVCGVKLFADGAIGPGTAAIYGAFDTGKDGQMIYSPEELKRRILMADSAGYAVAVHSIGDRSTDHVLNCFEACAAPSRHRIEHAMLLSDEQIARISRLGHTVTAQPSFLRHFQQGYFRRLGERASSLKRLRSILDAKIPLALSSDAPIVPFDPWTGLAVSTNRPGAYSQSENISAKEALFLYTQGAANALGDGDVCGSLAPGQVADYQLLEESPLERLK